MEQQGIPYSILALILVMILGAMVFVGLVLVLVLSA
jgi:hypothetical protein